MTPRIERVIDIFLDALNNNTLFKGACSRCAVGNIISAGMLERGSNIAQQDGLIIDIDTHLNSSSWGNLFHTAFGEQTIDKYVLNKKSIEKYIDKYTDFSIEELMKIEFAFETNTLINSEDYENYSPEEIKADQIKGLEAVVKVILEFEEDNTTNVKEVFTNKANILC